MPWVIKFDGSDKILMIFAIFLILHYFELFDDLKKRKPWSKVLSVKVNW